MKQSVTVGAQLLWGGHYGCNNGCYGCTIVMSYIEINKAVSQWLLTFNLCISVTWPFTCAFHIPCTHTPEIIHMHRGVCDNNINPTIDWIFSVTFLVIPDSNDAWIGLLPNSDASGYHWLDGSQTTYLNWAPGEPNVRLIWFPKNTSAGFHLKRVTKTEAFSILVLKGYFRENCQIKKVYEIHIMIFHGDVCE